MFADKVQEPLGVQAGIKGSGHQPRFGGLEAAFAQEHLHVPVPEGGGRDVKPAAGGVSGSEDQVAVFQYVSDPLGAQGR